jgi:hypothetical protein
MFMTLNNLEALLVSRNTEEESYNFILEDLNYAIETCPTPELQMKNTE